MSAYINNPKVTRWDEIPGKPSAYPPSPHAHPVSDITDFPQSWDWDNIEDIPDVFPPSSHTHPQSEVDGLISSLSGKSDIDHTHEWQEITNKPVSFPPSAHGHDIEDIDNLQSELDEKSNIGHTHTVSEITDFPDIPVVRRIETITLTTNASGVASHSYSPAFGATPNVHLEITTPANNRQRVRLTASSASGFSIIAEQQNTALLSLLGLDILTAGVTVVNGASVRATVIEAA